MLKPIAIWLSPLVIVITSQSLQAQPDHGASQAQQDRGASIGAEIPFEVLKYIHKSEAQRQAKIENIWNGPSSETEKRAAVKELNAQPFYGELPIDVPPRNGQMGVLQAGVTATVFRLVGEFDALVDLSWFNDRFETNYHRLFWIRGISTSGMRKGSVVQLRGVWKVSEKQKNTSYGDDRINVPVLEVIDVSRFVEQAFRQERQAFRQERYEQTVYDRVMIRAEMVILETTETVAASWLDIAESYFKQGQDDMGKRRLKVIIKRYPDTKAAARAKTLLTR